MKQILGVLVTAGALSLATVSLAGDREELEAAASDAAVVEELESPDGCSIKLSDPDNWKLICVGSASYDFNDEDERKDATREAVLDAKASMARFLNEKLTASDSVDKIVVKKSSQTKGGEKKVTKESAKISISSMVSKADEILRGVLTLETTAKWNGDDGVVRVKIGQSEKTMAAAGHFRSQNRGPDKSRSTPESKSGSSSGSGDQPTTRKRKSDSDF